MQNAETPRHPFLDDLTADAVLTSSVLREPVIGRAAIRLAVETVGSLYAQQTPRFMEEAGSRLLLGYDAVLTSGESLTALVAVERNADGSVPRVSVQMGPLGAVLSLAAALQEALGIDAPKARPAEVVGQTTPPPGL